MKKILAMALILVLALSSVACSGNQANSDQVPAQIETAKNGNTVAQVDDKKIDLETFKKSYILMALNLRSQYGEDVLQTDVNGKKLADIMKDQLIDSLVNQIVIAEYLTGDGFTLDEEKVAQNVEYYRQSIALLESNEIILAENDIDDAFIKQRVEAEMYLVELYNRISQQVIDGIDFDSAERQSEVVKVEAQHILVKTLEEANQIIERLDGGEAFGDLAKELSQDPGSAVNGGSLGAFGRGVMVKPFEDAAFALEVDGVSEPVETQFGFHVIKLNKKITIGDLKATEEGMAELASMKRQLAESESGQKFSEKIDELREMHDIKEYSEKIDLPVIESATPEATSEAVETTDADATAETTESTEVETETTTQ